MRKWKKSYLTLMVVISALLLLFVGCSEETDGNNNADGGNGNDNTSEKENFNATGLPIVDEEITIRVAGSYDERTGTEWNELETFQMINEGTNVNIDWELAPGSDWSEKRNLMLAGNADLPDVMLTVPSADVVVNGSHGQFIPLEDLIDEYAPNLTAFLDEYPEVRRAITAPDGHIYSLPLANMAEYKRSDGNTLWINTTWLDEVGKDMPETTDELYEVLKAFKDADLGLPLTAVYDASTEGLGNLFGSFGTLDETFIVKEDEVEFVRATDEYKEVVKYLRKLFEEGLLDQEIFSQEVNQMISKLSSGDEAEVGAFFSWSADRITNSDYKWDYESPIVPLIGPDGDQVTGFKNPQLDVGKFVITDANEHPEATIRWADRAYDPEVSFALRQGPNRTEKVEDGKYEIVEAPEGYTSGEWRVKETPYNRFIYGFSNEQQEMLDLSNLKEGFLDPDSPEWYDLRKDYMEKWLYPQVLFTKDQYDGIARYETDILDHTDEMTAKWITEGGIEDEWDSYIDTLNKMGLEDYTEIYQEGYDTYIENSEED